MKGSIFFLGTLTLFFIVTLCNANDNGLGRTPHMGWNTWNRWGCDLNETIVKEAAKAVISKGLKAVGYQYLTIDDCWQISRNPQGVIQADPVKFPSGIKSLADFIHSLGLKFGLYSSAGFYTCQHRPGSLHYEDIDAKTYAEWGVDMLRYDNCYSDGTPPMVRYPIMENALNKTGRKIYFQMCEWGVDYPATWARPIGNSWRTTVDITDNWLSMTQNIDLNNIWADYAGPGGWNDPDNLEVGNTGMTETEYKSHFALWAIAKAPLMLGMDVSTLSGFILEIVSNPELIAVNQDPLGIQGRRVASYPPTVNETTSLVWTENCTGASNQQWKVESDGTIRTLLDGRCLEIFNCSTTWETNIEVSPCGRNLRCPNAQKWVYNNQKLINGYSGQCLTLYSSQGPSLVASGCNGDKSSVNWNLDSMNNTITTLQGQCLAVRTNNNLEVWAGPLSDGSVAVALWNRSPVAGTITANWSDIGIPSMTPCHVRDLFSRQDFPVEYRGLISLTVQSHDISMLKITPVELKKRVM